MGGAIGIAGLGALQLSYYFHLLYARLAAQKIHPTASQAATVHNFIAQAETKGIRQVQRNPVVDRVYHDLIHAHAQSFQLAFYASAAIALLGAVACAILVRRQPRTLDHPVFGRRSRWVAVNVPTTPALTRVPPEVLERSRQSA